MSAGNEAIRAESYVDGVLHADGTTNAYTIGNGIAERGATSPCIIYQFMSGRDVVSLQGARAYSEILMQIVALGESFTQATLMTLADRIDTLFGNVRSVNGADFYMIHCNREQPISHPEIDQDGVYRVRVGGLYRLEIQMM